MFNDFMKAIGSISMDIKIGGAIIAALAILVGVFQTARKPAQVVSAPVKEAPLKMTGFTPTELYDSYLIIDEYDTAHGQSEYEVLRYRSCLIQKAKALASLGEETNIACRKGNRTDPPWTKDLEDQVYSWDAVREENTRQIVNKVYDAEPIPYQIEITQQATPSNMGLDVYIVVTDSNGETIDVTGDAHVTFMYSDYPNTYKALERTVPVSKYTYTDGTRGQGAFKRNARFAQILRNIDTTAISGKSGEINLEFQTPTHGTFRAKTSVFYP
jgi:hypothetical protein